MTQLDDGEYPRLAVTFDDVREAGGFVCAGKAAPARHKLPVAITPYVCPWCVEGYDRDGRCLHCAGSGTTDDPRIGISPTGEEVEPARLPRPPGVMRRPCTDCAYRPGSYERRAELDLPDETGVFFCHHGLKRTGRGETTGYEAPVMVAGMPIGAMVCGGWWDIYVDGAEPPVISFRDPGGSDRTDDAPRDV